MVVRGLSAPSLEVEQCIDQSGARTGTIFSIRLILLHRSKLISVNVQSFQLISF